MSNSLGDKNPTLELQLREPQFVPSWVDRLTAWITRLPGPAWLFYVILLLSLYVLFNVVQWIEGSQLVGYFDSIPGIWALYIVYYLALMHYLNGVASRALHAFRPALVATDAQFEKLHRQITMMPAGKALSAGGIGILLTLLLIWSPASLPQRQNTLSQYATVVGTFVTLVGNFIIATSIYHSIRQLRIVSRIHQTVTRISVLRRDPLYAFSVLTARTGAGYVLAMAIGISPRTGAAIFSQATEYFIAVVLLPLAVAAFVLPLLSMHNLIVKEKQRLQEEVGLRLEAVMAELNQRVDNKALDDIGNVKNTMESLLIERDVVNKTPTLPWQTSTLTGFLSAFVLPLVIWLTQQVLNRVMNS